MADKAKYKVYKDGYNIAILTAEEIHNKIGITQQNVSTYASSKARYKGTYTFERIFDKEIPEDKEKLRLLKDYDWDNLRKRINPKAR